MCLESWVFRKFPAAKCSIYYIILLEMSCLVTTENSALDSLDDHHQQYHPGFRSHRLCLKLWETTWNNLTLNLNSCNFMNPWNSIEILAISFSKKNKGLENTSLFSLTLEQKKRSLCGGDFFLGVFPTNGAATDGNSMPGRSSKVKRPRQKSTSFSAMAFRNTYQKMTAIQVIQVMAVLSPKLEVT